MCLNCRPNNTPPTVKNDAGMRLTEAADLLTDLDMSFDAIDLISVAEYLNRNN